MKGTVNSFNSLSVSVLNIIVLKMYIFRNRMEWTVVLVRLVEPSESFLMSESEWHGVLSAQSWGSSIGHTCWSQILSGGVSVQRTMCVVSLNNVLELRLVFHLFRNFHSDQ